MLHPMQQPAQTQPSSSSSGFAGLVAALALPWRNEADGAEYWSGSDPGEDIETLSYERALRAHARYKPADGGDGAAAPAARTGPSEAQEELPLLAQTPGEDLAGEANTAPSVAPERELRRASVTIRVSKAECARLHQRAAEAGLTVSAYLRSCALEAETLRAQVKEALAELRTAALRGTEGPSHPSGREASAGGPGRDQGTKQSRPGSEGVRLARVLGHIGKLWIGLSSGRSS
jgi:predicted DNA binding CopG/RHH family protein